MNAGKCGCSGCPDAEDTDLVADPQFQVQIVVNNRPQTQRLSSNVNTTEIRVTGGMTRPGVRRLPPIAINEQDPNWTPSTSRSGCLATQRGTELQNKECRCNQSQQFEKNAGQRHNSRYIRASERSRLRSEKKPVSIMSSGKVCECPTEEEVILFLQTNPDFLDDYVMDEVELDLLERWIIRKSQRNRKKSTNLKTISRWKFCVHADKRKMLENLTRSLQHSPSKGHVLWELSDCISSAINADYFRLYVPDKVHKNILLQYETEITAEESSMTVINTEENNCLAAYVGERREIVRLSRNSPDPDFPNVFKEDDPAHHIICEAVVQPDGDLAAVIELIRDDPSKPFEEEDEEITTSYLVWGGIAIHYAQLYVSLTTQKKLNEFLLHVVKSIFQDMVSMDALVVKIMNFAQRLVNADRASLFLVDYKAKELYATLFDVGNEDYGNNSGTSHSIFDMNRVKKLKEIRFPMGTGIAGEVAMTGDILNIVDAYADPRFNRNVDQITGYKTETILCMPIYIRGTIIGVMQMVNKKNGVFVKDDEDAFKMFAVYCGLALHHAKLYDKIRKSEQKYRVALEVLSYHNTCTLEEETQAINEGIPTEAVGIDDYYCNPFDYDDYQKVRMALFMFNDLFDLIRFDEKNLIRFMLTIRKNYRRVPYHNWTHGFTVANSMYAILKATKGTFTQIESLALFISAICHDLDHRGKNNKFMCDTESPLAAIYTTSTMEHHHFNQTITILQQEGHNILNKLSHVEYKQVLGLMKHCILATDLALFFNYKSQILEILEKDLFSWSRQDHRLLILAISMTASDLSASAKPWHIQTKTVEIIFEEFYQQGDEERAAGRSPIPMMDRSRPEEQPSSQVGFLNGICIPCYTILQQLLPETQPLLDMCSDNLQRWQKLADGVTKDKENKS